MMDGQVRAIRAALDESGRSDVPIMSYAAKYASAFYGPFREAADSAPAFGDRRAYQLDPPNAREALAEIELDLAEGADIVMVKPALPYLDVLHAARERFDAPLAAYQVSGEYAAIMAAVEWGWLDLRKAALESLIAIARAGADITITYFARQAAEWLAGEGR
jgi:porphobilinogen synthase